MDNEKIFFAIVIILALVALAFTVYSFFSSSLLQNNSNYDKFVASENPDDICAVPAGYTEQQWKEHLSHHPDRYAKCLNK